jgi:hypothetical protein
MSQIPLSLLYTNTASLEAVEELRIAIRNERSLIDLLIHNPHGVFKIFEEMIKTEEDRELVAQVLSSPDIVSILAEQGLAYGLFSLIRKLNPEQQANILAVPYALASLIYNSDLDLDLFTHITKIFPGDQQARILQAEGALNALAYKGLELETINLLKNLVTGAEASELKNLIKNEIITLSFKGRNALNVSVDSYIQYLQEQRYYESLDLAN